jgi:hypothetical protein
MLGPSVGPAEGAKDGCKVVSGELTGSLRGSLSVGRIGFDYFPGFDESREITTLTDGPR